MSSASALGARPKNRRFRELGVGVATAAILPGLVFGLWLCGWYDRVTQSTAVDNFAGEARGRVSAVKPLTKTIRVSANAFGFGAVPFTLDEATRIVVGDKEGGFGDLHEGVLVKIVFQRRQAGLVASCVEFLERRPTAPSDGCRSEGVVAQHSDTRQDPDADAGAAAAMRPPD